MLSAIHPKIPNRNEGFQTYGGGCFFFHAVILILDHASSPKSESVR